MKVLVITPTTGSNELKDAINSVKNQTFETEHLIVCDGKQFANSVSRVVEENNHPKLEICYLPFNTGSDGFYGHRIMAAFSHLVNHDYVLFLDQDNWYEPDHVESCVTEIKQFSLDWSYSLRKVFDKDKTYICNDNCESLGSWPVWVDKNSYLIDSSSYCFKTSFLKEHGHLWHWGWGADRRFYTIIKDHIKHRNYSCTNKHTLCYRLGGNEGSVQKEFFIEGNKKTLEKYNNKLPWLNQYS